MSLKNLVVFVELRSRIESVAAHKRKDAQDDSDDDDEEEEEDEAGEEEAASSGGSPRKDRKLKLKVGPGKLVELGDAVDTLIHKIVEGTRSPARGCSFVCEIHAL